MIIGISSEINVVPLPAPTVPKPKIQLLVRQEAPPRPNIDDTWSVIKIATEAPPYTWEEVFKDAILELKDVSEILEEDRRTRGPFFPLVRNIFKAFELTRLDEVKVVLIGQDPYPQVIPGTGQPRAQGLSFSVSRQDTIPASLQNIYKELQDMNGLAPPHHGDLSVWARRGVLLLNMSLTVRAGDANSHVHLWSGFLVKVVNALARRRPNTVYILLGKEAQSVQEYLNDKTPVVAAGHPSSRNLKGGFLGANVFNKANEILASRGIAPVNWHVPN